MSWTRARTTSAVRRTGGFCSRGEPTVRVSGLAAASQLKMVFGQTRKNWAVSAPFQARTFLISRMRNRAAGVK